jgi:hypothetical protein
MIEPLDAQRVHGIYAASELREAENMMRRIAQWDTFDAMTKEHEFAKGTESKFFEVPGFQPRWCHNCNRDEWFDYREDPEGACMTCGAWDGQIMKEAA